MEMPVHEEQIEDCLKATLQEVYMVEPRVLPECLCHDRVYEGALNRFQSSKTQRTEEWFSLRHNLLTATAIGSLFGSLSKVNEVIYEKCRPMMAKMPLSLYDTRHWGVRYEPVSRAIYEFLYKTKVEEFGCLVHPDYDFIGASPDGINMDPWNRERFGRLLEIKNVVSREITGEPLDEYWIQMQIQMEVCDLETCDFVETRIKEFLNKDDYILKRDVYDLTGVILHFMDGLENYYVYHPVGVKGYQSMDKWIEKEIEKRKNTHSFVGPLYWYLEEFSCVVVPRCRAWFGWAEPKIRQIWETILKERVNGYEHRKPCKRIPSFQKRRNDDIGSIVIKMD
jgi:putative phage-type endonuclease